MALAILKSAAAANPPIRAVCTALFAGRAHQRAPGETSGSNRIAGSRRAAEESQAKRQGRVGDTERSPTGQAVPASLSAWPC
jgi:hypothetical protein